LYKSSSGCATAKSLPFMPAASRPTTKKLAPALRRLDAWNCTSVGPP
jgi:hypothetical protein